MSAKDIQELGISYREALRIILKVRETMEQKGYLVPKGKTKLALTWMIRKELGLKWLMKY